MMEHVFSAKSAQSCCRNQAGQVLQVVVTMEWTIVVMSNMPPRFTPCCFSASTARNYRGMDTTDALV